MSRRSGSSTPPPDLVFFLDENLGRHTIADRLRKVEGIGVDVCTDEFAPGTQDVDWLPRLGDRVLLTKDDAIRFRGLELQALVRAKVCAFFLAAKDLTGEEMAELVVANLAAIRRSAKNYVRPCLWRINQSGVVAIENDLAPLVRRGARRK